MTAGPTIRGGARSSPTAIVEFLLVIVCATTLVAMVTIIATEVIIRNFFGASLQYTDEVGGYLLVAIAFLSLPIAQLRGSFHNVDLLYGRFPPRLKLWLQVAFAIVGLFVASILFWHLWRLELTSWRTGDQAPSILMTPLWIPRLAMPVGMGLLWLALLLTLVRSVLAAIHFRRTELPNEP